MEKTIQELFDEFVALHGAGATILAAKSHVHPNADGNCKTTGCPVHYICNTATGNCQLDLGG